MLSSAPSTTLEMHQSTLQNGGHRMKVNIQQWISSASDKTLWVVLTQTYKTRIDDHKRRTQLRVTFNVCTRTCNYNCSLVPRHSGEGERKFILLSRVGGGRGVGRGWVSNIILLLLCWHKGRVGWTLLMLILRKCFHKHIEGGLVYICFPRNVLTCRFPS